MIATLSSYVGANKIAIKDVVLVQVTLNAIIDDGKVSCIHRMSIAEHMHVPYTKIR
jgi:hypothetical protein